ncbi:SGNH hydrolase [Trametes versicolor FP-101664 SS1]|uniref:SGNH hydrolase n=1 Tax=Trametes versicolor (strain FP-101664) TaxID=717944 RepID=UPI0004623ECA|nr:SGNH hydrolase [Trametes versicolor FP-101664 SS1]EIW56391.1 SGNH hydrolase [Trametes versicolor FP-101664 SS1]
MGVLAAIALACAFFALSGWAAPETAVESVAIPNTHQLIYYHGRWDASPGTWWAGSGLKLHVQGLSSLALHLGPHTTTPLASVGVSVDYQPFYTVNVSAGLNTVPLSHSPLKRSADKTSTSVVRINAEGWQNNRINLESIILNKGAKLLPYTPSKLAFQFIGDSLSAGVGPGSQGQFLPQGVDQAWPFLTGEFFKAEHRVNAQPGAALSDIVSYGNQHGVSFQYFRTEDTGYFDTTDHNYTTPWDFARDRPAPTHIVIHIGANDASQNVTADAFVQTYQNFLTRLRGLYPVQPIFVFTPWGWPNADGSINYYYDGQYERIVQERHVMGDRKTFLVNTTGWVSWEDVFPDNQHPNVAGHQKIASLFGAWLTEWGLQPQHTSF